MQIHVEQIEGGSATSSGTVHGPRDGHNTPGSSAAEPLRPVNTLFRTRAKSDDIDLGLAISHALCKPGQKRTSREIAAFCGCAHQRIEQIEWAALRKLKQRITSKLTGGEIGLLDEMIGSLSRERQAARKRVTANAFEH